MGAYQQKKICMSIHLPPVWAEDGRPWKNIGRVGQGQEEAPTELEVYVQSFGDFWEASLALPYLTAIDYDVVVVAEAIEPDGAGKWR
jgi:hypothetical protein